MDECKHGLMHVTCSICMKDDRSAEAGPMTPLSWRDGSVSAEFLAAIEALGGTVVDTDLAAHLKWDVMRVRRIAAYLRDEFSAIELAGHAVALTPDGIDRFARRERNFHPSHLFPSERCR